MAYRDENWILDQIYEKQIFLDFYYEDFKDNYREVEENAFLDKYSTLYLGTIKIGFRATFLYAFLSHVINNSNLHDKNPNIFAFYMFI